jgi:release factor glutamine methyltransferase
MNERFATLLAQLTATLQTLPDKPEETPESTLRALWHTAAGRPMSAALSLTTELPALDANGDAVLQALLSRRRAGEPLAHLTGRQYFMGLEMLAGPEALVPRKETELLGRTAVVLARERVAAVGTVTVVDVCTGAGNIALAIAAAVPAARVFGADLSEQAVSLARRNARLLGLEGRVEFRCGDLLAPFATPEFLGKVDVLTCNPPYISSARVDQMSAEIATREPRLAFDGGPFGVAILLRLLHDAPSVLRPGGALAFEVGLGQGAGMLKRMEKLSTYREVRALLDEANAIRGLMGCT